MMVAGVGFKKNASSEEILEALNQALQFHRLKHKDLDAFATLDEKSTQDSLCLVAKNLNIPVVPLSRERLKQFSSKTITKSETSMIIQGLPSLAETAALAAIGNHATLLGPRIKSKEATCALAIGMSDKQEDTAQPLGSQS